MAAGLDDLSPTVVKLISQVIEEQHAATVGDRI
jgi:hypothetical protein